VEKELKSYPDLLSYLNALEGRGGAAPAAFSLQEFWAREEADAPDLASPGLWHWEDGWNTRIAFIDHQNQAFLEYINALQCALVAGNRSRVAGLIPQLIEHVQRHFELEERLMELAEYPGRDQHQELHRAFGGVVERTCQAIQQGDRRALGLLKDLRVKLVRHMVEEDRRYAPWLRQRLGNHWIDDLWHLVIR
jgi:hemerythrin